MRPSSALLGSLALLALSAAPGRGVVARLERTLRDDGPNSFDREQIEHGYYERLIDSTRRPEGPHRAAASAPFDAGELAQTVDDVREYVLRPNLVARHKGASWATNSQGMRDRAYEPTKPPGVFRIALAGDSIAAGWGVDDGVGFEPTIERLWKDRSTQSGGPAIEVLNYAVPGHAPGQRWEHLARVAWSASPDLVVFVGTAADLDWDERRLRALIPRGLGPEAPVYHTALTGVPRTASADELKAWLRPRNEAILSGVYARAVSDCRAHGAGSIWVLLPRVGKAAKPRDRDRLNALAATAGFDRVVDLSDAFDSRPAASLAISPDDFHPNALGHAELARRIDIALGDFVSSAAWASRHNQGESVRPRALAPSPAGAESR